MQLDASLPSTVYRVDREAMRLFDTPGGLRYACETLTGIDAYKVTGSSWDVSPEATIARV